MYRLITVLLTVSALTPAMAQVSSAELSGTVSDGSGASIANAKITLTNPETNIAREATTEASGAYLFTLVPPGTYNLNVEAAGFRKLVQNGIPLQVNQRARLDFTMQLGQVTETVEVAAAAPLLESQSSSLGAVVNQQFVGELPLNGRNFIQLAVLQPGVNGAGQSVAGTIMSGARPDDRRPGSEIFSNGNRENSNNFLYDGVDNNDRLTLSIVLRPGVEAIKEFKVQTNLYSADLGRNSGAVIDVVTKSGTNQIHGSVFEFLRNSAMDARNFFNRAGTAFPSFRYNQFGFSLGGPVVFPKLYNGRNKTFFFADYEGFRRNQQVLLNTSVPQAAMRGGNFGGVNAVWDPTTTVSNGSGGFTRTRFPNDVIPTNRFDPVSAKLINAFPAAQSASQFNNYLANLSQKQDWDQGDVRVDHQISPNDTFFARWSIQHTTSFAPNTFPDVQLPGLDKPYGFGNEDSFAGPAFNPTQHAVASYVKILSPRLINEFRAGFNRFVLDYTGQYAETGLNLGNKIGIPNSNTNPNHSLMPIINLQNYTGVGHSRSLPIFRRMNTFQYTDNMTFNTGAHTLKWGGDFRRRQVTEYQTNRGNGRFNFSAALTDARNGTPGGGGNAIASFLLGYAALIEQDFTLAWVGARGIETGFYFADDWRVTRKLTFNLGMRWEYYSPFSEVANRWANFDPATATVLVAGRDGVDKRAGVHRDFGNYAPRFGFAYQVGKSTVVRGGYGLFYNPNGNGGALLRLQRHIPFGPIYSVATGDTNPGRKISDGFPAPPDVDFASTKNPFGGVVGVSSDFSSAYAQQYNLSIQQEMTPIQTIFKFAYVGNLGRRLGTVIDLNQPIIGTAGTSVNSRRPFFAVRPNLAGISYAVSDGLSNYNAFQMTVEKRMGHGLGILAGYTWSHGIDDIGTDFGGGSGTPQDIRNRRAERGNSNFDIRHRTTISYTYVLPILTQSKGFVRTLFGGWQTNGIWTIQTGLPFSLGLQTAQTNGAGGSRPDAFRDGTLDKGQRSITRWFDPSAYGAPTTLRFGNAARNNLYGPGRVNFDSSLFKDFAFGESFKVQFRAEAFNTFNHPQFGQPNGTIGNAQAGVIGSTVGTPRVLQLALKLQW